MTWYTTHYAFLLQTVYSVVSVATSHVIAQITNEITHHSPMTCNHKQQVTYPNRDYQLVLPPALLEPILRSQQREAT